MALLKPTAGTLTQNFNGVGSSSPAMYHQNYRGLPLAAFKLQFPGSDGYSVHYHGALDFGAATGTPIIAAETIKIVQFGTDRYSGGALYVFGEIRPGTRLEHWHLSRFRSGLYVGQIIPRGQILGYVGSSGWSTGPHLHWVLQITEKDPDGVTRKYLYNAARFMSGGDLASDARVKPLSATAVQYVQINSGASVNIRTAPNLLSSSIYATSSATGIYRNGVRIAAADAKMRLMGWATGAGYVWAKVYFNGGTRYIAKPFIHIV